MSLGIHRNNVLMLNLTAISSFCLLVLVGGYLHSGSILPATQGASQREAAWLWAISGLLMGLPLITGVLWVFRLVSSRRQSGK